MRSVAWPDTTARDGRFNVRLDQLVSKTKARERISDWFPIAVKSFRAVISIKPLSVSISVLNNTISSAF